MQDHNYDLDGELDDLKQELEHFQAEKERVRAIIGKIGGVPRFSTKLVNIIFGSIIVVSVVVSFFVGEAKWHLILIEFAILVLSIKIIYMIHCQMRVNHFKLWMLSSIEWRLNEVMKQVRKNEPSKDK